MKTLRLRLILSTAVATSLILIVAGVVVYLIVRASFIADFDTALLAAARGVQAATELDRGRISVESEAMKLPEFSRKETPDYFEVWQENGTLIDRSPSLSGRDLNRIRPAAGKPVFSSLILPDGTMGRQAVITFEPLPEGSETIVPVPNSAVHVTLIVARHTADLQNRLRRIQWILIGVGVGATVAAVLVMLAVISSGLRPLNVLALQISRIDSQNLSERVELRDAPAELTAVVDRLNGLLDRLRDAMTRERGFTAAVAHELRTPLAGLETLLEVCSMRERSGQECQKTVMKCLGITRRMHAMTDNLLLLARADAGQIHVVRSSIDLASFLDECWMPFAERASARGLKVTVAVAGAGHAMTSPDLLRVVINNLFDNAASYADENGSLNVHARIEAPGTTEIVISNSAPSLDPEIQTRVFDRFWRGDVSRTETGAHCGLGLSLCQQIVDLIGGSIRVAVAPKGLFEVALSVPSGKKNP